jgi:hypothetical protein
MSGLLDALGRRPALERVAPAVGALSLLTVIGAIPLEFLVPQAAAATSGSVSDAVNVVAAVMWFAFGASFTVVGVIVARRAPRNPMGWLLLWATLAFDLGSLAPAYAYLDYHTHHGALPLGPLSVMLSAGWTYGFLAVPLIVLCFPDGRLGPRWRWPLRVYMAFTALFTAGTLVVAANDLSLRVPVDSTGTLIGLDASHGRGAWFTPIFKVAFLMCLLLAISAIVHQVRRYRRATGDDREQLKWLGSGGITCLVCMLVAIGWTNEPAIVDAVLFPIGLTALPVAIGVGILKYRLYEIDRLISRTLSYAILTAALVGVFVGLIALTTDTLAISGRVGVAASTLAAAALFNPLRVRIQRVVDRRFNRARYDAEATVAAFTARLRDAVEIDAIRSDLLGTVNRAVQPSHVSVWIRE